MLKYLWMVVEDLFLLVTVTTWMHALLGRLFGAKARILHGAGLGLGAAAAVTFSAFKSWSSRILWSEWNHYTYAVIVLLTLLFVILSLIFGRRENRPWGAAAMLTSIVGACLSAAWIFFYLPYPLYDMMTFNTMGQGWLSAYFAERLGGWLLALAILYVYSRSMRRCACDIKPHGLVLGVLDVAALSMGAYCFMRFFNNAWQMKGVWKNWPINFKAPEYAWVRRMVLLTGNQTPLFTAVRFWIPAVLGVLLLVLLFARSTRVTDAYDNPAQKRKLRARNRSRRRVAAFCLGCIALFGIILIPVKAYDTREIVLSAAEEYELDEAAGVIRVPILNVSDGHLHRFEYVVNYKNKDRVVRWIVVKKPGSVSFGVGLDACDVCGNAGYYERSGKVICKRCDVVMNINTIGFKGGCNPIPLPYELSDGYLEFKIDDIAAGASEF